MGDATDDDAGWWNCTLCTFKNSTDRFTCEMCHLRRGTSTRKPRCSADTIVAQVVKQQEQIHQQTKASISKPAPKSRSSTSNTTKETSVDSDDSTSVSGNEEPETPTRAPTSKKAKKREPPAQEMSHDSSSQYSSASSSPASSPSSATMTPEPTTSSPGGNPFKIRPIEINGNLIKYSPPTSTGRTGLIIDKKRFTQHSVTVNDVTITFTEFATRQSKYVRKKKKKKKSGSSAAVN